MEKPAACQAQPPASWAASGQSGVAEAVGSREDPEFVDQRAATL